MKASAESQSFIFLLMASISCCCCRAWKEGARYSGAPSVRFRVNPWLGFSPDLLLSRGDESIRIPSAELVEIARRHGIEIDADGAGGGGEAPEGVAELDRQAVAVEWPLLEEVLAHVAEHFAGFLGESSGRVEQTLILV